MHHIVALSGGKDSTALAVLLNEHEPRDYTYVCTPTGDELPELIDHWLMLGKLLGKPILPVTTGKSLSGLIRKWNALPNNRQRWCTRVLKLEAYYGWLSKLDGPVTSYVGLRADEEGREGMHFPETSQVSVRFPLREWGMGEADVWAALEQRNIIIPARTDCARCYHQTLGEWWRLWRFHPDMYEDAINQEDDTGHTFRSPSRDRWATGLRELRERFEAGHIPRGTVTTEDFWRGGARPPKRKTMCRVCSL